MKPHALPAILASSTLAFVGAAQAGSHGDAYFPDAQTVCNVTAEEFAASWAKITFPDTKDNPLAGLTVGPVYDVKTGLVYVFPPDGPGFSSDSTSTANCAFFRWSEQMFLWITSTIDDQFTLPDNPAKPSDKTPYVFSSEFLYRLEGFNTLTPQSHQSPSRTLNLRTPKPQDTVGQAGRTNGVLFTQDSTDVSHDSSLVYYEVLTNRPYGYVRDAIINSAPAPFNFAEFPDSAADVCNAIDYGFENGFINNDDKIAQTLVNLYCPELGVPVGELPKIDGSSGSIIPQLETAIDYLTMSFEVKSAWVLASSVADPDSFIIQKGSVPVYTSTSDANELVETSTAEEDLALVGMHIVGTVNGHPEMVWATFEHKSNAPNIEYFYLDSSGSPQSMTDISGTANTTWLASDGTSTNGNGEFAITGTSNGMSAIVPASASQTEAVDTPTNVNRANPWGSLPDATSAEVNSEVISANVTTLGALSAFYKSVGGDAVSDPRLNYILTGASWGDNGIFPDGSDLSQIIGTPAMANTTMETFQQLDGGDARMGCFTCHNISTGESKFKISHIFEGITAIDK